MVGVKAWAAGVSCMEFELRLALALLVLVLWLGEETAYGHLSDADVVVILLFTLLVSYLMKRVATSQWKTPAFVAVFAILSFGKVIVYLLTGGEFLAGIFDCSAATNSTCTNYFAAYVAAAVITVSLVFEVALANVYLLLALRYTA